MMKRVQVLVEQWQYDYINSFDYIPMGEIIRAGVNYLALNNGRKEIKRNYVDDDLSFQARKSLEDGVEK